MRFRRAVDAPIEPAPSLWQFPYPDETSEIVAVGADLDAGTLLSAYRSGLFPMPLDAGDGSSEVGWWSPNPRGILPPRDLRVSRSLRRSRQRFVVTTNRDFEGVIRGCGNTARKGGWITSDIRDAYVELFELGWAHSVETWTVDGELVGGLYGVGTHGLFAGESMFSVATDASKVALVHLVERIVDVPDVVLDVQWLTDHLATLGAIEISRHDYHQRLEAALSQPSSTMFDRF